MSDIIFAHPRHDYGSYFDYKQLIRLASYPTCFIDEIDPQSTNCYIFATPATDWHHGWEKPKARIIYYDLEFYGDVTYYNIPGLAEIWSPDAAYAKRIGGKHVVFGSDVQLAGYAHEDTGEWIHEAPARGDSYDVILLSYMSPRRQYMLGDLITEKVSIAPDGWGRLRHEHLQQTVAMLNVHQRDEYQAVAPQRFAIAAAYGMPLITETLPDLCPFGYSSLLQSSFKYLAGFAKMWTRPSERKIMLDYGRALHQLLCVEMSFKKMIEKNV